MIRLRTRLILYFFCIVFITLLVLWILSYRGIRGILEARVSETTVETLKQIDKNISLVLSSIEDLSLFII